MPRRHDPARDPATAVGIAGRLHEEGRSRDALAALAGVDPGFAPRWLLEFEVRGDVEDHEGADAALERARALLGPDDHDLLHAEGAWRLDRWELDAARRCYEALDAEWEDPDALEHLAVLADLRGDHRSANRFLREAADLDPDGHPLPPRIPRREFERLVQEAAADLPDPFIAELERIPVIVEPVPPPSLGRSHRLPPTLLGLFTGRPVGEREAVPGELPPTIHLFQRNLERVVRNREQLREQIRITLYHELAHALGFDEEGVHGMGLG